jgi:hypothetical protein
MLLLKQPSVQVTAGYRQELAVAVLIAGGARYARPARGVQQWLIRAAKKSEKDRRLARQQMRDSASPAVCAAGNGVSKARRRVSVWRV